MVCNLREVRQAFHSNELSYGNKESIESGFSQSGGNKFQQQLLLEQLTTQPSGFAVGLQFFNQ